MQGPPSSNEVSLIIPVLHRPELLVQAIESVLAGTRRPGEILVVVDAPQSSEQADALAARQLQGAAEGAHSSLEILFTGRQAAGPGAARNKGLAFARGDWISFLDSDDLHHPEKLERQLAYLARRPHLLACQTRERWLKAGRQLSQPQRLIPRPGRFLRDSFRHCLVSCSAVLLHRQVFAELGDFDESFPVCEDFDLWLRVLERYSIGLVNEELITKRAGGWPQASSQFHSMDALRIRAILKRVRAGLQGQDRAAAQAACEEKLQILARGAERHNSQAEVARLAAQIEEAFSAPNVRRA